MDKFYAGIGSRETPDWVLNVMTKIAHKLDSDGFILRSGGAKGADSAFELGALRKEIFIANDATTDSLVHAEEYHPRWDILSEYAKRLQARNSMILLGKNLDAPVKFVICWTKNAKITGGTGQALRVCNDLNIPIFNLANQDTKDRLYKYINIQKKVDLL